jgi:hypothetical protein
MGSHPKKFPIKMTGLLQDALTIEPMVDINERTTSSMKDSPKMYKSGDSRHNRVGSTNASRPNEFLHVCSTEFITKEEIE